MRRILAHALCGLCLALALAGCASLKVDSSSAQAPASEKSMESRLAFGRLSERRQEYDKAIDVYQQILAAHPNHPEASHRLAVIRSKQAKFSEAEELFTKCLILDTPSATLHNDFGYCFFLQDKLPQAEQQFRLALEKQPEMASAWNNLGLTLGQQNRVEESRAAFQKANLSPAEVHCSMAYVFTQLYQLELAQAEFRQALTLDPTLKAAAEGLLQVSQYIPGEEPVTIVATHGAERRIATETTADTPDTPASNSSQMPVTSLHLDPPANIKSAPIKIAP